MKFLSIDEVRRNFSAVWGIFRGEPGAAARLDASYEGFWRSFLAIIFAVPLYVALMISEVAEQKAAEPLVEFSLAGYLLLQIVRIPVEWIAFPLVMLALARPLGIGGRYSLYITAYNWSGALIAIPAALPAILVSMGLLDGPMAIAAAIAVVIMFALVVVAAVRMLYMVARVTLEATVATAIGLVILDLLLGLSVGEGFDRLAAF